MELRQDAASGRALGPGGEQARLTAGGGRHPRQTDAGFKEARCRAPLWSPSSCARKSGRRRCPSRRHLRIQFWIATKSEGCPKALGNLPATGSQDT